MASVLKEDQTHKRLIRRSNTQKAKSDKTKQNANFQGKSSFSSDREQDFV